MIVRAQLHHHAALADLLEAVFIGEGYAPASSRERLRNIAAIAEAGALLVATGPSGEVAGAVACVGHGAPLAEIALPGEAEMRLLSVHPGRRGRGVGGELVRACIAESARRGCGALVLSTQPSMAAAQRLYRAEGFERAPSRDWVHANGSERLVFARALAAA